MLNLTVDISHCRIWLHFWLRFAVGGSDHSRNFQLLNLRILWPFLTNMVYEWDKHKHICRRLYVDEKRPVDEIVEILRAQYNFTPRYVSLNR